MANILIVDEDESLGDLIAWLLEREGYNAALRKGKGIQFITLDRESLKK
ncbi:MAG: response regulator transcription factor [Candidatus Helarchaeota archaeon]|nr:response regulator transcription factor [Candidatus Helarchaeota archaeon]